MQLVQDRLLGAPVSAALAHEGARGGPVAGPDQRFEAALDVGEGAEVGPEPAIAGEPEPDLALAAGPAGVAVVDRAVAAHGVTGPGWLTTPCCSALNRRRDSDASVSSARVVRL